MTLLKHKQLRLDITAGLFIFIFAVTLRLLYQHESITYNPIRADAGQYFATAYNLSHFGAFSHELYTLDDPHPPKSRTDISPGYPVFLTFFMSQQINIDDFLKQVLRFQSFLGALTATMIFCIGRMSMNTGWALLAGVLTAMSPHLIASEGYLLTESLFTFLLVLSALLCSVAWRYQCLPYFFLAGVFVAMSFMVRYINQSIILFIAPMFLMKIRGNGLISKKIWANQILCLLLGILFVCGTNEVFQKITASDTSGEKPKQYYSASTGFWRAFLFGTYPGIKDSHGKFLREQDPELFKMQNNKMYAFKILSERFKKNPVDYLQWYFGGKILALWRWDDEYNKDVYIYPMERKGFEENQNLHFIYHVSRFFHWPLYFLSLSAPIMIFFRWRYNLLEDKEKLFFLTINIFLYYLIIFSVLQPVTRYGTPLRPISYVLSVASLSWLINLMLRWEKIK